MLSARAAPSTTLITGDMHRSNTSGARPATIENSTPKKAMTAVARVPMAFALAISRSSSSPTTSNRGE